ncbi:MAG: hypothetical protein H5T96_08600 [Tissierellales bacterium]|nr:hypothetical protein [Tissierellales bacterium]
MRKIKIISIVLVNLLVIILLTSCTNTNDEDKEVIESFLNSYFEQFNYTEEDWENLIQKLDAEMLILGKDEIDLEKLNNLDDDSWLKAWEETLTAEEIERLVQNRLLPNLYLKEYKEVKYSIEEIKKINDSDSYSAKIKFTNVENKNDEKEIHILLDMVDTEQGRRIKYVDLEEFKNLFHKK